MFSKRLRVLATSWLLVGCGSDDDTMEDTDPGLDTGTPTVGTGGGDTTGTGDGSDTGDAVDCAALADVPSCNAADGCTWQGFGFNGTCVATGDDGDESGSDDGDDVVGPDVDCPDVPTPFVCLTTIGCTWNGTSCVEA